MSHAGVNATRLPAASKPCAVYWRRVVTCSVVETAETVMLASAGGGANGPLEAESQPGATAVTAASANNRRATGLRMRSPRDTPVGTHLQSYGPGLSAL